MCTRVSSSDWSFEGGSPGAFVHLMAAGTWTKPRGLLSKITCTRTRLEALAPVCISTILFSVCVTSSILNPLDIRFATSELFKNVWNDTFEMILCILHLVTGALHEESRTLELLRGATVESYRRRTD